MVGPFVSGVLQGEGDLPAQTPRGALSMASAFALSCFHSVCKPSLRDLWRKRHPHAEVGNVGEVRVAREEKGAELERLRGDPEVVVGNHPSLFLQIAEQPGVTAQEEEPTSLVPETEE